MKNKKHKLVMVLFNPIAFSERTIDFMFEYFREFPVFFASTDSVRTIEFVDTHIPVIKKKKKK